MSSLQGKVALVTGASKGIGAAIALELAARGAAVAVNYSGSKAGADKVVKEIEDAGGKAIAIQANLADPESIGPLVATVAKKLGPINVLVNNAGIYDFSPAGGSIINIGSVAASGVPAASVYSATKGAVNSITVALSKELGPKQIRVNALNPGMVETEGTLTAGFIGSDFHQQTIKDTPLGRIGQPDDIASIAAFLASDDSAWVSGQTIQASGGARL